jgi:hypothetical protein
MAEKEYIEREKAFDAVFGQFCASSDETEVALNAAIEEIRAIPAANVQPVVLCRDCKYAPIGDKDGDDLEWPFNEFDANPCPHKCSDNWYSHKPAPDFFCAAGENREES